MKNFKNKLFMFLFTVVVLSGIGLQLNTETKEIKHNYLTEEEIKAIEVDDDTQIDSTQEMDRLINEPKIINQTTGKEVKLNNDLNRLAVNVFFESTNQDYEWKEYQVKTTLKRISVFHKNSIDATIKEAVRVNGKMVINKCHFSWYCNGEDIKYIPSDKASQKAWEDSVKAAKVGLTLYKQGKIKYWKYDHYCTKKVEKKTSWVKYMKKESRFIGGDHVWFEHDQELFDKAWSKKMASMTAGKNKG